MTGVPQLREALEQPRDVPLPENPEEWPLIPKLELLAKYADLKDDERGAFDESERTVQRDVREAIKYLRCLVEVAETSEDPDYERADEAFNEALKLAGAEAHGPTMVITRFIVDVAVGSRRLVDPQQLEVE